MPKDRLKERIMKFQATEEEVVTWYLRGVLEKTGNNQSETKRVLDINRSTVRRRMEKLGLAPSSKPEVQEGSDDDSSRDLRDREDDDRDSDDRHSSGGNDDPRSRGPR